MRNESPLFRFFIWFFAGISSGDNGVCQCSPLSATEYKEIQTGHDMPRGQGTRSFIGDMQLAGVEIAIDEIKLPKVG